MLLFGHCSVKRKTYGKLTREIMGMGKCQLHPLKIPGSS